MEEIPMTKNKRMLIVPDELVEEIDKHRGDMDRAEFIEFCIQELLRRGEGERPEVSWEEFESFKEDVRDFLDSFLDFLITYEMTIPEEERSVSGEERREKAEEMKEELDDRFGKGRRTENPGVKEGEIADLRETLADLKQALESKKPDQVGGNSGRGDPNCNARKGGKGKPEGDIEEKTEDTAQSKTWLVEAEFGNPFERESETKSLLQMKPDWEDYTEQDGRHTTVRCSTKEKAEAVAKMIEKHIKPGGVEIRPKANPEREEKERESQVGVSGDEKGASLHDLLWVPALLLFGFGDTLTTYLVKAFGGMEANPIMGGLMNLAEKLVPVGGFAPFVIAKTAILGLLCLTSYAFMNRKRWVIPALLSSVGGFLVMNNVSVLLSMI
ncbi:hypothetical protein AKJ65_07680 [candidate division MSBL1 archaeon SCGC-AAA259E19]|uniref:DUF5658 domain-containing protein n=1 Tax=candidate division MSBL1 archaeon SCGC-AAA259E19 TaxID=1698264 RepID=A0A133UE27_9EURY|nr:hypothetical protein AKJ65_07680 [candidate division MSBL1 archaeon SCGC-AAA259E19]